MTKEVLISIKGMQFLQGEEDLEPVEVITPGEYYSRNGKHYIRYEEVFEGIEGVTTNLIKLNTKTIEVTKKGTTNIHMVFEQEKKHLTYYKTPFGTIPMGIATTSIGVTEEEKRIELKIAYTLEMNNEYLADCNLSMVVEPKAQEHFSLR